MTKTLLALLAVFMLTSSLAFSDRLKVVLIVANDLGYGTLRLETLNIDQLRNESLKFTPHLHLWIRNTAAPPLQIILDC